MDIKTSNLLWDLRDRKAETLDQLATLSKAMDRLRQLEMELVNQALYLDEQIKRVNPNEIVLGKTVTDK